MNLSCRCFLTVVVSLVTAACGGTLEQDEESVGAIEEGLECENALNPNALNPNALNPNALNPNALNPNALNPNALSPGALAAIQMAGPDGALSRQLLRYVVSCAFAPTQSFSFSWTDELGVFHHETYGGMLGLATTWMNHALSQSDAQWVSACLASRVNWYGASVTISSRSSHPGLNKSGTPELTTYTHEEGSFWGNLFVANPQVFSCHHAANRPHSRGHLRDCAAGHLGVGGSVEECGILQIVGSCDARCLPLNPKGAYRPGCDDDLQDQQPPVSQVITVFLE